MRNACLTALLLLAACSAPTRGSTGPGGTTGSTDGGPTIDAGYDAGIHSADGGACAYDAGPRGVSCGKFVQCEQGCTTGDECCRAACYDNATPAAQALANTLNDCLGMACPSTDGGPCAMDSSSCTSCEAVAAFQTCMTQFSACNNDTSASDAGAP